MPIATPIPPTKARLLDAAQRLMLAHGFAATTVDEICAAAKLTKGSFFHYFESKDQLGKELLECFCASGASLHGSLCGNERDPLKRVFKYIDGMIAFAKDPVMRQGCLLGSFAQELSDTHPQIRAVCCKGFEAWAEQFARELAAAKRRYAPRAAFDPRELAEHLITVVEGGLVLAKARQEAQPLIASLTHYKRYLKSVFAVKSLSQ